jgi:hypothetical protein
MEDLHLKQQGSKLAHYRFARDCPAATPGQRPNPRFLARGCKLRAWLSLSRSVSLLARITGNEETWIKVILLRLSISYQSADGLAAASNRVGETSVADIDADASRRTMIDLMQSWGPG